MFDNVCRFLAEQFTTDIASWLLGEPIALTELNPSELSLEPIRADSLIFLQSQELILHIEFQTQPKPNIPFRMTDYRLRGYRRYPQKLMRQIVVYLKKSNSPLTYQTVFEIPNLRHEFEVIRLWEQPTQRFLELPGLLPFAALSQGDNPEAVLREVARQVEAIEEPQQQSNIAASAGILAGLVLKQEQIVRILRSEIMQESVIYQAIKTEGRLEGRLEGKTEEGLALILRQLGRRLGYLLPEWERQIQVLSLSQLEELAEALLDFSGEADLLAWLQSHQKSN